MRVGRFIEKIITLFEWLPIIWNDEDWDEYYLLKIIEFKINRIKNTIYKNKIIVPSEIREICIGINQTLDHIKNHINSTEKYEEIYGKFKINIGHRFVNNKDGTHSMVLINEDTGLDLTEEEEHEYVAHIMQINKFEQKEWDDIWNTIKAEGQKWWD